MNQQFIRLNQPHFTVCWFVKIQGWRGLETREPTERTFFLRLYAFLL